MKIIGNNFILSALLYTSYNSLLLIPMLVNLKKYRLKKFKIIILSVLISVILGILMMLIYNTNNMFYPEIVNAEMPNMLLATVISPIMKIFYGIVILAAIFTTALSSGFNFLEMCNLEKYEKNAILMCLWALICSKIGFSTMINIFFPFFGFLGFFQIIVIIKCLKSREDRK